MVEVWTPCRINGCVVRLGVMQGEFHWHHHDEEDEFFYGEGLRSLPQAATQAGVTLGKLPSRAK